MAKGDGMSFAEFTYPLLQAWDWWHMFLTKGVHMQIGGSDQYGNITAGMDAIKYISAHHPDPVVHDKIGKAVPFGITVPLLTTSSGQKFGKSAGNAVWLDCEQTSPFDLYKFFVRTSDEDVGKYLKLFTFLPLNQIDVLVKDHMGNPSQRKAQHVLAREFVELIHGVDVAKVTEAEHHAVFSKNTLNVSELKAAEELLEMERSRKEAEIATNGANVLDAQKPIITPNNAPRAQIKLPRSCIEQRSIGRIILAAGLATSSSDGHRLATEGGVYIGALPAQMAPMNDAALSFTPIKAWKVEDTKNYLIHDRLLILRRGKHNVRIIEVVADEDYDKEGLNYPGMKPREPPSPLPGRARVAREAAKALKEGRVGEAGGESLGKGYWSLKKDKYGDDEPLH